MLYQILSFYTFIMPKKHFMCSMNFVTARLNGCCFFQASWILHSVHLSSSEGRSAYSPDLLHLPLLSPQADHRLFFSFFALLRGDHRKRPSADVDGEKPNLPASFVTGICAVSILAGAARISAHLLHPDSSYIPPAPSHPL